MQSLSGFWEISFEITFWQSFEEISFHFVIGRKREKVTTERKGAGLAPFRNPTARISVFIAKSSCEEEKTAVGRLTLILIFEPLVSTVSFDATSFHSLGLLKSSSSFYDTRRWDTCPPRSLIYSTSRDKTEFVFYRSSWNRWKKFRWRDTSCLPSLSCSSETLTNCAA